MPILNSQFSAIPSRAMHETITLPGGRVLRSGSIPQVMGIINVTPDSFSDGGLHLDPNRAIDAALAMQRDGAAVIDVGGESTRPGSSGVPLDEELSRVLPVIEGIRRRSSVPVSIDTTSPVVARAAVEAGADIINDVAGLRLDERMAAVCRDTGAAIILMHMRGEPRTMQETIGFTDLIAEVSSDLSGALERAVQAGIARERIMIDPGIGFGKTLEQNLALLRQADELATIAPLLIGASRKAFIGELTGQPSGPFRMAGSLATVAAAAAGGAAMVRVHDVRETVDFLAVYDRLLEKSA
jgi:dihydropteroate synthase